MVGPPGLEPGTNTLWVYCSNQLSYRPYSINKLLLRFLFSFKWRKEQTFFLCCFCVPYVLKFIGIFIGMKFKTWEIYLPSLIFKPEHNYLLNPPATKFQTAVKAKKLNHHPVAGKITPRTIACSTTPAIKYCFKVIFLSFL